MRLSAVLPSLIPPARPDCFGGSGFVLSPAGDLIWTLATTPGSPRARQHLRRLVVLAHGQALAWAVMAADLAHLFQRLSKRRGITRSGLAPAGTCRSGLDQLLHDVVYGGPGGCGAARRVEAGGFSGGPPGGGGGDTRTIQRVLSGPCAPCPPGPWCCAQAG